MQPRDWLGERLRNDLFCVERDVKPQLSQSMWIGAVLLCEYRQVLSPFLRPRSHQSSTFCQIFAVFLQLFTLQWRQYVLIRMKFGMKELTYWKSHNVHSSVPNFTSIGVKVCVWCHISDQ